MEHNSDITKNRIILLLPLKFQLWAILLRLDRPIGWWLLVLPAWWAILLGSTSNLKSIKLILIFTIGAILMRGAGCIINDLWDQKIDKKVSRTNQRPISNGSVSILEALSLLLLTLLISFGILINLPINSIYVGVLSIPLIIIYPLSKRFTNYPQFFLGIVFSWGAPLGWSAVNENITPQVIFLYFGGIAWVFGYDSIYSIQDKKDDIKIGIRSTAVTFGNNLKFAISISYFIAFLFWLLASNSILWTLGVFLSGIHMIWQIYKIDMENPKIALKLFKSNRNLGLILALCAFLDLNLTNYY